jgi:glucose-6-phosphate 1-dehydrogenase
MNNLGTVIEWNPASTKPPVPGAYEVLIYSAMDGNVTAYAHWNGVRWARPMSLPRFADQEHRHYNQRQDFQWSDL